LDHKTIEQLLSLDPAERRAAITALTHLADPAALEALEDAAQNDPDPELRDEAAQAVRRVRAMQWLMGNRDEKIDQPMPKPAGYPHLLRDTGILVLWAVVGGILMAYIPVWLAPPHLSLTVSIYIFLGVSWVPVFLYKAWQWDRAGGCGWLAWRAVGILVLTLIVSCGSCWISTLQLNSDGNGRSFGITVPLFSIVSTMHCQAEDLPGDRTRSMCTFAGRFESPCNYIEVFIFEGHTGSPFVKLVSAGVEKRGDIELTPEQRRACSSGQD
jgi:hypothetical protein